MPLLEKKVAQRCKKREQRKLAIFVEPKQRHEVKWDMMTMTMTMGMDACFAPWGDKLEQAYWQPTDYYCK